MHEPHVVIVGAGLAGLACGKMLYESGARVDVYEASDGVGGRVRTDEVDGFLLDRGFQVFLTAYPEARQLFDYEALDLRPFLSGAEIFYAGRFHRISDPVRQPQTLLRTATSSIGSIVDKLHVLSMRRALTGRELDEIWDESEISTIEALRGRWGFSDRIIDRFFRPFLGGIMLDPGLETSSRMFEFVFRMLSMGDTAVPALGMGRLPEQLARSIPDEYLHLNEPVSTVAGNGITLRDGRSVPADAVIVATDGPAAARLVPVLQPPGSRPVTCIYFASEKPPADEPILMLDGVGAGPASNVAVMSRVSPHYAPSGAELISASVLGHRSWSIEELERGVRAQMCTWFGDSPQTWKHLRTYRIEHAQPVQNPPALSPPRRPVRVRDGLYVCGDHRTNASINGALESGRLAAEAVLNDYG